MILRRLQLRGIRSWEKGAIDFEEGFTSIVGSKGAGKSSIIAAIEFGLFGDEARRDYGGLMREGARNAEVVLEVEDQGRRIVITRGLSRVGDAVSQNPAKLRLEVDGAVQTLNKASDLNRDIKELLRVDGELLEYTCLARQEELKQLLNMDARSRRKIVDSLLGFDSFETAWGELGEILRDREGYARRLREEASKYSLESLAKSYNENLAETEKLKRKNRRAGEHLRAEEKRLEMAALELQALDKDAKQYYEEKKQIEEKRRLHADGVAKAERLAGRLSSLKQSLEEAEGEKKQLDERIEELWGSLANVGYTGKRELISLREARESLDASILERQSMVAVREKEVEDEQGREQALLDGEACPYCGQPLISHRAQKFRQERQRHVKELQRRIERNRLDLEASKQLSKVYAGRSEELGRLAYRAERLESQTQSIRGQLREAQVELDAVQATNKVAASRIQTAEYSLPTYDETLRSEKRQQWMQQNNAVNDARTELQSIQMSLQSLGASLTELSNQLQQGKEAHDKAEQYGKTVEDLQCVRGGCRAALPTLRSLYLKSIERNIQKTYGDLNPTTSFAVRMDDEYTPTVSVGAHTRSYRDLSGGERTEVALAYRIGLGNAIYEARTGTPMDLLILDEPTESLGNEEDDRAIEHLAEMLSSLKTRQIIVITHDQTFAQFAGTTLEVRKTGNSSNLRQIGE